MTSAVADTTLLSNFAHVNRADLPLRAFPGLVTTSAVLQEIAEGEERGLLTACDWTAIPVLDPTPPEPSSLSQLSSSLDEGELSCIAVALRLGAILVTDDRRARQEAQALSLAVPGTLGALCNLVQLGHLTVEAADELLGRMRERGYRSPMSSIRSLLSTH